MHEQAFFGEKLGFPSSSPEHLEALAHVCGVDQFHERLAFRAELPGAVRDYGFSSMSSALDEE